MQLTVVESSSAAPAQTPEMSNAHIKEGVAAAFKIAEAWSISNDHLKILLGRPSKATFFNWKAGTVRTVPHDTVIRISYLLGIYKALNILYVDAAIANDWVNQPNEVFGGQTALERICAGELVDLAFVRDYLDGVRGGWS